VLQQNLKVLIVARDIFFLALLVHIEELKLLNQVVLQKALQKVHSLALWQR
jgi:hypothetical protein